MAVVVDGPLDDEAAADLVTGLRTVLDDVRAVDEDAERLRARVLELAARLDELAAPSPRRTPTRPTTPPRPPRCCAGWPTATSSSSAPARSTWCRAAAKVAVPRRARHRARGPAQRHRHERVGGRHARGDPLPRASPGRVTKADARSPVHRRAWLDLIAVNLPATDGGVARQLRFVGLFPSTAYTTSVVDVPLVRRRVAEVITRSGVPADSHTGKELLDVLETYPRDELLQVGADELLPVALAVLHLVRAPADAAVPAAGPDRPVLVGAGLPAARPVHDRGPAGDAADPAGAPRRHERRVHGAVHRVGARPAALHRPRAGRPPRRPRADGRRRRDAPGRARRRGAQLDRRPHRRAARPVRRRGRAAAVPGGRRLPAVVPERLLRRAGRRRPRAARGAHRRAAGAAPLDAEGRRARRPPADHLPGRAAAAAVRGAAGPAEHGRLRRRRAAVRDRPHRRAADLDLRLRRRRRRRSSCRCCARCRSGSPRRVGRRLARRGRGRRPGRAGHAGRPQLAAGHRRARLRAVAAPGRAAVRPALRRADPGRAPRRRRPAGRAVRGPLLPRAEPAAGSPGSATWSSRCASPSARSSRSTPTAC